MSCGSANPVQALVEAQQAVGSCRMLMSLGTSSVVYPAAGLVDLALRQGVPVLEVNPMETSFSTRTRWTLRGTSGTVLPQLLDAALSA